MNFINKFAASPSYGKWILLFLITGVIFLILSTRIVYSIPYADSDYFSFWLADRFVWEGLDPYNETSWVEGHTRYGAVWISDTRFLYPLPLALLTSPLGLLSLDKAYITWLVLSMYMILVTIIYLLYRTWTQRSKHLILPIAAGVILFRPVVLSLYGGAYAPAILIMCAGIAFLWEKKKWLAGGYLLSFLFLKPSLGGPIAGFIVVWLLINKKWKTVLAASVSGIGLVILGFIKDPFWIQKYLDVGNSKISQTFGYSPAVWGPTTRICNYKLDCILSVGGIACLIIVVGCLFLFLQKKQSLSPTAVMSIAISAGVLITPYIWIYDQILLIFPVINVATEMWKKKLPFLIAATGMIFIALEETLLIKVAVTIQSDIASALNPLVVLLLVGWWILNENKYRFHEKSTTT